MATLNSGVIVKLLDDMRGANEAAASDDRKPALLQIRSIIPVLSEGDLWPNQGFYLKVSDASHVMYVSLPHEQDESILGNKLHLGQFIYADKLNPACPVPLLVGVRPVPGRSSCTGTPKNLIAIQDLVEIGEAPELESTRGRCTEKQKPRQKSRSLSASRASTSGRTVSKITRRWSGDRDLSDSDGSRKGDWDSDTDSTISSCSDTRITKRRSWIQMDSLREHEAAQSITPKRKLKPIRRSPNSSVSSIQLKSDSTLDIPLPRSKKKEANGSAKSIKNLKSSKSFAPSRSEVSSDPPTPVSPLPNRTTTEDKILWGSLPSNLLMLGKEVLRQRDAALIACVEALQEASNAERLLQCLSTYSELQSVKSEDHQPSIDRFFDLQDDLSESRLSVQSLSPSSKTKTNETDPSSPSLNKEAMKLATERKRNAKFWIKAALASDLTIPVYAEGISRAKNISEIHDMKIKSAKGDRKLEWSKGSSVNATADLANSLQSECRTLFLAFVEQYLDGLKGKFSEETNDQTVGAMLEIKRVSGWIDMMAKKEANFSKVGCKDNSEVEDSDFEIYGGVKNKIYRFLLMHIEKTAMAWENLNEVAQS